MGCLKGLTISSDGNQSTQYKVLNDTLPVYCSEKLYPGVGEIVRNMEDWDATTFYPDPPNDTKRRVFFKPYRVELCVESVATKVTVNNITTVVNTPTPQYETK